MHIKHIPCNPFVNQSERNACDFLRERLAGEAGTDTWFILSNLMVDATGTSAPDEVDLLIIGPAGILVIEVKHWDKDYIKLQPYHADQEADKLARKTKRIAGKMKGRLPFDFGFVTPKFLLTRNEKEKYAINLHERRNIKDIKLYGLSEWRELLELSRQPLLDAGQCEKICKLLMPNTTFELKEEIRTFADFVEMKLISHDEHWFHRVYSARRRPARDKVIVHLYDLSAPKVRNPKELAEREFQVYQKFQKSSWIPSLYDSFHEANEYPGEIYYFSHIETDAVSLSVRDQDALWSLQSRLYTALQCFRALKELHETNLEDHGVPNLHRNLTPGTIRVRSNNEPLFTGLHLARLSGGQTISKTLPVEFQGIKEYVAPEVLPHGLIAYTREADIFALCASLRTIFTRYQDETPAQRALSILEKGADEDPAARPTLDQIIQDWEQIQEGKPEIAHIAVDYWDEDTIRSFGGRYYGIISRQGSGSFGKTFKVKEVDPRDPRKDLSGPYVAKVITHPDGAVAAQAYARVRPITTAPHLAGVLEVAPQWNPDEITVLLQWLPGEPLSTWKSVLPLYLEDLGELSLEEWILQWLKDLCMGLSHLHRAGFVHGDVSPKNIIVNRSEVALTDYDLTVKAGSKPSGGTPLYCSPSVDNREVINPSDDLYALASSFFEVLFDRSPFSYSDGMHKERGLNWDEELKQEWSQVAKFLDRAVHPDPSMRFSNADNALEFLHTLIGAPAPEPSPSSGEDADAPLAIPTETTAALEDNQVEWLRLLLQSYPGSRYGNIETRGLDSEFARKTYVETRLDVILKEDILARRVNLVILCGNAGDGKTAFLQRLAQSLGFDPGTSANRIWDFQLPDGLRVYANLDGSAAYQDRSAQELLDEFFAPFLASSFPQDRVHLLAINDGPLLAWLEGAEDCLLKEQLLLALDGERIDHRIRFIDLNQRSLVGGIVPGHPEPSTEFIDRLLDSMIGDPKTWEPCLTCRARERCTANHSIRLLHDPGRGKRIRRQLTHAFQAVHLRGETHITARELRAALGYIFFGAYFCTDLHQNPHLQPERYYDRAFDPDTPGRQGALLQELVRYDPALEPHPRIDAELLREAARRMDRMNRAPSLASLKREAYFEWSEEKIAEFGDGTAALNLARGQHLQDFIRVGTGSDEDRRRICRDLCLGIARLEELPLQAFRADYLPLKISPRTPTETAFWVSKPLGRFSLRPEVSRGIEGLETLHSHVILTYRYESGLEENLIFGAELFHLLMELKNGYQMADTRSDDIFSNLLIFKQRLAQEDDRRLYAWSPQDNRVFQLNVEIRKDRQTIVLTPEEQML